MSEKTLKPTQRRLRDARKRGEAVRSRELSSLAAFVALWICLWVGAGFFWKHLARITDVAVMAVDPAVGAQPWERQVQSLLPDVLWVIVPLLGVGVAVAVFVGSLQTRG